MLLVFFCLVHQWKEKVNNTLFSMRLDLMHPCTIRWALHNHSNAFPLTQRKLFTVKMTKEEKYLYVVGIMTVLGATFKRWIWKENAQWRLGAFAYCKGGCSHVFSALEMILDFGHVQVKWHKSRSLLSSTEGRIHALLKQTNITSWINACNSYICNNIHDHTYITLANLFL